MTSVWPGFKSLGLERCRNWHRGFSASEPSFCKTCARWRRGCRPAARCNCAPSRSASIFSLGACPFRAGGCFPLRWPLSVPPSVRRSVAAGSDFHCSAATSSERGTIESPVRLVSKVSSSRFMKALHFLRPFPGRLEGEEAFEMMQRVQRIIHLVVVNQRELVVHVGRARAAIERRFVEVDRLARSCPRLLSHPHLWSTASGAG